MHLYFSDCLLIANYEYIAVVNIIGWLVGCVGSGASVVSRYYNIVWVIQVNGNNLERASHDTAVEVIKTASNPVEFVVQSLVEDSLDNTDTGT